MSFLQGLRNMPLSTRRAGLAIAAVAATAAIAIAGTLAVSVYSQTHIYSTSGTADGFGYQWDADWNGSGSTMDSPVIQIEYLNSFGNLVTATSIGAFLGSQYYSPGRYTGAYMGPVDSKWYVNMSCPPPYQPQVTHARYRFHSDIGATDSTGSVNTTVNTPWRTVSYPW